MGTNIYGSYDELVIELGGLDRWRTGRQEVRIAVDDVWSVRVTAPANLVSLPGERVLRTRSRRSAAPVLVLDLAPTAEYDRIVVASPDADEVAAWLRRSGIGAHDRSLVGAR